jgi:Protein of unknown function (DUF3006)
VTRRKKAPARARKSPKAEPAPHASIDRLEGEVAVLLVDGEERHVPRAQLPEDAREGDVVDLATLSVDAEATEALRAEVRAARERARKGKPPPPSGSFDL